MSFKSLNDRLRLDALPAFLSAADLLHGLLLVVLFDKRIDSIFGQTDGDAINLPGIEGLVRWPQRTQEKLFRISHLMGLALAGLSRRDQDIFWITDQDDIVANLERHTLFVHAFANVANIYLEHRLGHLRIATTASDSGDRDLEDFVSIADLAAGAVCHILNAYGDTGITDVPGLVVPPPVDLPMKSRRLLDWFSNDSTPLKRLVLSFQTIEGSPKLRVKHVEFPGSNSLLRQIRAPTFRG